VAASAAAGRLRLLGIPGSLRQGSYNRGLLLAAQQLAPDDVDVEIAELAELPLYNRDLGEPEPVARLKARVRDVDALLIASPEYNCGTSGVLKNAIDWLSRPPFASVLRNKPVTTIGASTGRGGTRRAQAQLHEALRATGATIIARWPIFVDDCAAKFDAHGRLVDDGTWAEIAELLGGLSGALQPSREATATELVGCA
jgi:chromate reductase, NAD(P)H dehydrogenase (quinone)